MDKNKKKILIVISVIIVLIIGIILTVCLLPKDNKAKDNMPKDNMTKDSVKNTTLDEKSLDDLLESKDYKVVKSKDSLNLKYEALNKIIYSQSVTSIDEIYEDTLFRAIAYKIKDENIKDLKEENGYQYGTINKELFDKQIKDLFNTDKIKITNDKSGDYKAIAFGNMESVSDKFRHAILIEEKDDNYYFKFYGGVGTYITPRIEPMPIKLYEIREYDDYYLLVSKAVYVALKEDAGDHWIMNVAKDSINEEVIDEVTAPKEAYFTVDINKYLDNAGTIYTVLKKTQDGNSYFISNRIDN